MSERERRLDNIRKHEARLVDLSRAYKHLRWMAEQPVRSEAFLDLADAAGALTLDNLAQTEQMLKILMRAGLKEGGEA